MRIGVFHPTYYPTGRVVLYCTEGGHLNLGVQGMKKTTRGVMTRSAENVKA